MESRKLGNKTKIIKLMSKVGKYGLIILTYQLFESFISKFQAQLQERKEEQVKETATLLRNQYAAFLAAYNVLREHITESNVTEEVLRNWFTYYGQVFQQVHNTHELIGSLQSHQTSTEAMVKTIQDQLVLEMAKLEKLEKQEHQWNSQDKPSIASLDKIHPHMKILLDTVEEKSQLL